MTPLEVLRIEDRIKCDLVDECFKQQRKHCFYIFQFELDEFCPVLIEESVNPSKVLEEGDNSVELILSALLLAANRIRNVRKKDVADGLTEDARVPDLEIAFVRLAETLFVDVMPATAELQEGCVCFQNRREDVFVAEVGKQVGVS